MQASKPKLVMKRLPWKKVEKAINKDEGIGFCMVCHATYDGWCEPDARRYTCTRAKCGAAAVYGAEEILANGWVVE